MTIVTVMTTIYLPEERIVTTVITVTAEGILKRKPPRNRHLNPKKNGIEEIHLKEIKNGRKNEYPL